MAEESDGREKVGENNQAEVIRGEDKRVQMMESDEEGRWRVKCQTRGMDDGWKGMWGWWEGKWRKMEDTR